MKKFRAPGKLILSGEHAVVYGNPAIAMAIDRFAETAISWQPGSHAIGWQNGSKLSKYALDKTISKLDIDMPCGLEAVIDSNIPRGCGMGSSAAVIVSIMYAISSLAAINLPIEYYAKLGREIENLQHGRSSGLDINVSLRGGCLRFENSKTIERPIPEIPMYVVNTGMPEITTGECVAAAEKYLTSSLLQDFAAVTNEFDQALQENNLVEIQNCIRANHELLTQIGVVPKPVQEFIAELEQAGAAAKICGAGASAGEKAGAVLVVTTDNMDAIAAKRGYSIFKIKGVTHGVQNISG